MKNNNFKENLEKIDSEYCKNAFDIKKFKKDIWKKHLKILRMKVVKEVKDMLKEGEKRHLLKENNVRMEKIISYTLSKLKRKLVNYPQIKLIKLSEERVSQIGEKSLWKD